MKRLIMSGLIAVLLVSLVIGGCQPAEQEESAADFYQGKTIEIIVTSSAGGGYDRYARMIGPYIVKYTGAANVIVTNMTGAGGKKGRNYVYNDAAPDGLTLILAKGAFSVLDELAGWTEGINYDLLNFNYLGLVAASKRGVVVATENARYNSLADMLKATEPVKAGGTAKIGGGCEVSALIHHALDIPTILIPGYEGTKQMRVAIVSGELDTGAISDVSTAKYVAAGDVVCIGVVGDERSALLPDIPTIYEQFPNISGEGRDLIDMRIDVDKVERILLTSPNIPADRVQYLQEAYDKSLNDPDLLAASVEEKLPLKYLSGEDVKALVNKLLNEAPQDLIDKFRYVALEKYY